MVVYVLRKMEPKYRLHIMNLQSTCIYKVHVEMPIHGAYYCNIFIMKFMVIPLNILKRLIPVGKK
jgi:hypothetical protein